MMRGLSTRNYGAVVKDFQSAYGIEKSAVSENFIEASREKVKQLMERPLGELQLCAVLIDGTPFKDRQMIAALAIGCDGRKTVLGIREGATENSAVVSSLLSELVERGLDFSGLLVAERQFRKVIGHRQIPLLLSSMANAVSKKPIAKGAAVA